MTEALEEAYRLHHSTRERAGFAILEKERGNLFSRLIGTGKKVLDLGCRDGTLTRYFTEGNDVTGADIDSEALENTRRDLGIHTIRFDLNAGRWPIEAASFDIVVAAEVLEHLYFPERVLERVVRLLRPGGMLAGSVPNAFSLKCRLRYITGSKRGTPLQDQMHINQFEWHEFERLLYGHFSRVRLYPLGNSRWGLRDAIPALFSFGIGFCAHLEDNNHSYGQKETIT